LGIYGLYGVRKACQAVYARNQDIVHALSMPSQNLALVLADPHAQHIA
jgi:hypothetical protein